MTHILLLAVLLVNEVAHACFGAIASFLARSLDVCKSTVLSTEEEAMIVAIRLPCRRCSPDGFFRSPE